MAVLPHTRGSLPGHALSRIPSRRIGLLLELRAGHRGSIQIRRILHDPHHDQIWRAIRLSDDVVELRQYGLGAVRRAVAPQVAHSHVRGHNLESAGPATGNEIPRRHRGALPARRGGRRWVTETEATRLRAEVGFDLQRRVIFPRDVQPRGEAHDPRGAVMRNGTLRSRSTSPANGGLGSMKIGRMGPAVHPLYLARRPGTLRGMRRKRHHKPIVLTDEERQTLEQWARRPKTAQRLALRSRIVLACAEGLPSRAVAARVQASSNSVCKWRERFRVRRLPGLTDEPRPGAPRKATDDRIVEVITRTLEGPPAHATQWTTRSLADVAGR